MVSKDAIVALRMRKVGTFVIVAMLAGGTVGCESVRKMRSFFRGEPGATKIVIDVTPNRDVSIALDGHVVSTQGAFEDDAIAPGLHKLSVSAPEHYTFNVPIEVRAGVPFQLSIALRRVPKPEPTPRAKVTRPRERTARTAPSGPPARLPEGTPAVQLTIAGDPSSIASLDGLPIANKALTIDHVTGDFGMGRAEVRFRVGAAGMLELQVPDDGTQWFRDGDPLEPGARLASYRGKTRPQQIQPNGETQTIYLAR